MENGNKSQIIVNNMMFFWNLSTSDIDRLFFSYIVGLKLHLYQILGFCLKNAMFRIVERLPYTLGQPNRSSLAPRGIHVKAFQDLLHYMHFFSYLLSSE